MAYSSSEFNVPEFKEYNPAPYSGGYDISRTYGETLSPSDAICYPLSASSHLNSPILDGLANGSTTMLPSETDMVDPTRKAQNGTEPLISSKEEEEEKEKSSNHDSGAWLNGPNSNYWGDDRFSNGYGTCGNGQGSDYGKAIGPYQSDGFWDMMGSQTDNDYNPWSGCGYGREEDAYDYGRPVPYPPSGYCPDDMGPCASLFGSYFPCLSWKDQKRDGQHDGVEQGYGNHWKGTAEYLFGSLYPYGERRDENISYGAPNYGYEKHYQGQPHHVQIEHNEQPSYNEVYQEKEYPLYPYGERRAEIISYGAPNYGYEKHYQGQPHHVQIEHNEQPSYNEVYQEEEYPLYPYDERRAKIISYGAPNYGYEKHYQGQPHHVQIEHNEQPSYNEVYQEEEYPLYPYGERRDENISYGAPNYGYEKHYQGQPHHVQIEYNEESWFQQPSYNEVYQEEEFPQFEYGTDSYNENGEYFYYNQRKYSYYDE